MNTCYTHNNKYILVKLYDKIDIYSAILSLAEYMHDQRNNTPDRLKMLAEKYYSSGVCFCAKTESDIIGICAFYCNDFDTKTAFLSTIIIDAKQQGAGVGGGLLKCAKEYCLDQGMYYFRLEVANDNYPAIHFYEKNGFVLECKKDRYSSYICQLML